MQIQLFSTTHCHLCEQAKSLLQQLSNEYHFIWQIIEIANDEQLLVRYDIKIPVIKRLDTNAELSWPFTILEIKLFLDL